MQRKELGLSQEILNNYIEMLNYSISHILGMTHQFENVIIPSFMGLLT